jgi:hypothetical protein
MTFKCQQSKKKSADSAPITMFASVFTHRTANPKALASILAPRPACQILATCINCISCLYVLVCKFLFPAVSTGFRTLINGGVLLSILLHAILHPSHHLMNVLLQIANKLGLSNKKKQKKIISKGLTNKI